jgi:hypothetical protein
MLTPEESILLLTGVAMLLQCAWSSMQMQLLQQAHLEETVFRMVDAITSFAVATV